LKEETRGIIEKQIDKLNFDFRDVDISRIDTDTKLGRVLVRFHSWLFAEI